MVHTVDDQLRFVHWAYEHGLGWPIEITNLTPCSNSKCNRPRSEFPMAFRQDPYCSDNCRKALGLDLAK